MSGNNIFDSIEPKEFFDCSRFCNDDAVKASLKAHELYDVEMIGSGLWPGVGREFVIDNIATIVKIRRAVNDADLTDAENVFVGLSPGKFYNCDSHSLNDTVLKSLDDNTLYDIKLIGPIRIDIGVSASCVRKHINKIIGIRKSIKSRRNENAHTNTKETNTMSNDNTQAQLNQRETLYAFIEWLYSRGDATFLGGASGTVGKKQQSRADAIAAAVVFANSQKFDATSTNWVEKVNQVFEAYVVRHKTTRRMFTEGRTGRLSVYTSVASAKRALSGRGICVYGRERNNYEIVPLSQIV